MSRHNLFLDEDVMKVDPGAGHEDDDSENFDGETPSEKDEEFEEANVYDDTADVVDADDINEEKESGEDDEMTTM